MSEKLRSVAEAAVQAFGGPGGAAAVQELRRRLDGLRAEDLQLHRRMASLPAGGWDSEELWTHPSFRIVLFAVPAGQALPLHGHPQMSVLMKVLWGTLRIVAYDWAEDHPWTGLARRAYERRLDGASPTLLVTPKQGNVHRVEALEPCAFLDVVAPPYSDEDGRPCHYYAEAGTVRIGSETLTRLVRA